MGQFKAIATVTWRVESDTEKNCLELVRRQLEQFLATPKYEDFCVQLDVTPMKSRKKLDHIATFPAEEILSIITEEESRREFYVDDRSYCVRMNSDRYHVFRANHHCVACGIEGTKMILDLNPGDSSPHFNLYAEENGQLLLMTKDHKIPKSKGGEDRMENYSTMCAKCNNLKGNANISDEQVRVLRDTESNLNHLPRRALKDLVNSLRQKMHDENQS